MRITGDEIRLIAFIVFGLLIGATVRHWRELQHAASETVPVRALSLPTPVQKTPAVE